MQIRDETIVGKWVAVMYENNIYPGIVVAIKDDDVEVNAMQSVGQNRYKWPKSRDQICYEQHNVLALIPEPVQVNRRFVEITPDIWQSLQM
jgi:hypothetical protein